MHTHLFNHLLIGMSEILISVQLNGNDAYESELISPDVVKNVLFFLFPAGDSL